MTAREPPASCATTEAQLATFAAMLNIADVPAPVVRRAHALMLDWLGSALAAKGAPPVEPLARFHERRGPADGPSEILIHRRSLMSTARMPVFFGKN